jgi:hypothetical protein
MRPPQWHPPIKLSKKEQKVVKRIRRAKLFIFLPEVRHELFDTWDGLKGAPALQHKTRHG